MFCSSGASDDHSPPPPRPLSALAAAANDCGKSRTCYYHSLLRPAPPAAPPCLPEVESHPNSRARAGDLDEAREGDERAWGWRWWLVRELNEFLYVSVVLPGSQRE